MRGLFTHASCSWLAPMREQRQWVCTTARDSDWRGATAAVSPTAPSRPMAALSMAAPFSIKVISEMTPSWGK